jgi:iron(III) transport system ATP-binding protein
MGANERQGAGRFMSLTPSQQTRLALKNVSCAFGETVVVKGLNLNIAAGDFVSLLGPSGCGKTTTLRMIAGFVLPTEGTIELDGKVISAPDFAVASERRQMSMIFQSYAVWPNMTVGQNVAFGLECRRLDRQTIVAKVREILETVRLGELIDRYPAELSGGQQQRVALARSIVIQPRVLLLDEPLSNLDANLREEMRFEIRRLHDKFGFTTVYVTHDQGEAMVTSDRIAVMNRGEIEQIDTPYAIYNQPRTRFVAAFIGRTNFLEGRRKGETLQFPGFALSANRLPRSKAGSSENPVFSVRPQSISLRSRQPDLNCDCVIPATIAQRAYLGEVWDYVVRAKNSELRLKVTAPPAQAFDVGTDVWMELDPGQMAEVV